MEVGRHTYGADGITMPPSQHGSTLRIGSFCSIAGGVTVLLGGEHRTDFVTTFPFAEKLSMSSAAPTGWTKGDVIIGSDVWIGENVTILSGVNIGHGAVVGAGSLVASDVRPYDIVGGNPARKIRARFPPAATDHLLALAWWEWPDDKIARAAPMLTDTDPWALLRWIDAG